MHLAQHGFIAGKSTLINLLQFDKYVIKAMLANHPYDIIYSDYCKAFDKLPHQCVVDAAREHCIGGKALAWIGNFFIGSI